MMNSLTNDEEVIRQYLNTGSTACFETLYSRYVSKVYRRCLSLTQDSTKAEDFTHDIFLKVFNKLDRFQERSSFSTWLYSISYNYCMDQMRLAKRLDTVSFETDVEYDVAETDEVRATEQMHQQLSQVLECLAPNEVTLLRLKYEEGLDISAIARQFNLKNSAVKMRLKRSRDKIQQLYQQRYGR